MTKLEELEFLERRDGIIRPEAVVEYAENPESALHSDFEWNNKKAGYNYRLWQARQIIGTYVTIIPNAEEEIVTRTWVSLMSDRRNGTGYRNVNVVMNDNDMREELLQQALADSQIFRRKYALLKELAGVFLAMEEVEHKHSRAKVGV